MVRIASGSRRIGVMRALSVNSILGVITRCCRDAGSAGERVFRVLADVSGIGGECFSWMGGG